MRYGVMQSGLSVPVASMLSTGLCCGDPHEHARAKIARLYELPEDAIQTQSDLEAVMDIINTYGSSLENVELEQLRSVLADRNSANLPFIDTLGVT